MVATLDDTKRIAIAMELADMKELQQLLISNEEQFVSAISDEAIRKRIHDMLEDDRKNLGILETVIVQYGVKGEPRETSKKMIEQAQQLMQGHELSLYQKVSQHELLKHKQVMAGLLVHKCAQKVGADIEVAIGPLNTINFENRAHQEQLKGIIEVLGVTELTGKEPDQGLWGRVQDAIAAFSGVMGSVVTQNTDKDDMNIQTLIRLDHNKTNTIFTEIGATKDPQKLQEYFGQLYKDLTAHAIAEEQIVYPRVRSFYGDDNTQELYDEQSEMKRMLDEIKAINPESADEFRHKVKQLMEAVGDHIRQEESTMFAAIDKNCTDEQKEQMATEFKAAKSKVQEEMAASTK
ncbi:hemerythrin domain-containing protein [Microcoleus sp. FACHB-831]|uniref:hemerythrin domain-containing protein n=1 Tax=Microcoleus sp. FACHB-831 TaxID=2692827 RepID=UPI0016886A38|nr:hemerythrin domain-containing protein [Microcoleus sp. FACHB-831]MBD1923287.1 hemerythrin domain-containing protein [Microcoleus sp. FACHB-831]